MISSRMLILRRGGFSARGEKHCHSQSGKEGGSTVRPLQEWLSKKTTGLGGGKVALLVSQAEEEEKLCVHEGETACWKKKRIQQENSAGGEGLKSVPSSKGGRSVGGS